MKLFKNRFFILSVIAIILAGIITFKYYDLQVVNGKEYKTIAQNRQSQVQVLKAPRGEIKDRNGNVLVSNKNKNQIEIIKNDVTDKQLNENIFTLVEISIKEGFSYVDDFPVTKTPPFKFTDKTHALNYYKDKIPDLKDDISATDFLTKISSYYSIDSTYSLENMRKIAGVRYMIESESSGSNNTYVFCKNADIETISAICETPYDNSCIKITQTPERKYVYPYLATHILGTLGQISDTEYDELSDKGYSIDSLIGKSGIEKVMEDYLKGTDGYSIGSDTTYQGTKLPVSGNSVTLTIDVDLQTTAEKSLDQTIKSIPTATGGAIAVLNVNNGEILALASNPTYNLEDYPDNYEIISQNTDNPLFNRALSGAYAPGSTFKMLTAVAALEEGVISKDDTITDKGVFKYSDFSPHCWIYDDKGTTHGSVNVCDAIKVSCNYYFYETGLQLGIDKIEAYAQHFGLCDNPGTELKNEETKGFFATQKSFKDTGKIWNGGNVLQIAIGESFNSFSPLQLGIYISTLVNGGIRYKPHFIKSVETPDNKQIVTEKQIINKLNISKDTFESVMEGMKSVTEDGTASDVFGKDYPIEVGGKTGTSTIASGEANGIFVAFAPYDKPEIAVCVVIEHGQHGNYAAPIAKDIFNEYFNIND